MRIMQILAALFALMLVATPVAAHHKSGHDGGPGNGNGNGNGVGAQGTDKVEICHNGHTITVAEPAAENGHDGDQQDECEETEGQENGNGHGRGHGQEAKGDKHGDDDDDDDDDGLSDAVSEFCDDIDEVDVSNRVERLVERLCD
jgi:hypothetical protein